MFDFRQSIALSVFGALSSLVFWAESPAQAVTFQLSWTGQILGYQAEGSFSYDETQDPKIMTMALLERITLNPLTLPFLTQRAISSKNLSIII